MPPARQRRGWQIATRHKLGLDGHGALCLCLILILTPCSINTRIAANRELTQGVLDPPGQGPVVKRGEADAEHGVQREPVPDGGEPEARAFSNK